MTNTYVLGFPRVGEKRELKFALESFWAGKTTADQLETVAKEIREKNWLLQRDSGVDFISSNDFSLYDNMLDTSVLLGAIPKRFANLAGDELYFAMARGNENAVAMQMTKWFNTNYHYIVPELSNDINFKLNAQKVLEEYKEAKSLGVKTKINLIGAITYLSLAKTIDGSDKFTYITAITKIYKELLELIATLDDEIVVEFAEPVFVTGVDTKILSLIKPLYDELSSVCPKIKIVVATYFEHSNEATKVLVNTPIWGIALDFVHGAKNSESLELISRSDKVLIAGIIDGRNIWKSDLAQKQTLISSILRTIDQKKLIISTSCSLLHVPFTVENEENLDDEVRSQLSFAKEKLTELKALANADNELIRQNSESIQRRKNSTKIHNIAVQNEIKNLKKFARDGAFEERIKAQRELFGYGALTTTTIGSFPQTPLIRETRKNYKQNLISKDEYESEIKKYIDDAVAFQEEIGLDVLVHGEPERNDMVEYFGELLDGFAFTSFGWVQSYGSRCVKPPIIYGDIARQKPMTVDWISYAQKRTKKPVKGMLTGPVTILNWSFVRDDIARSEVATQLAVAINKEVDDLQKAGIKMIQVDEAAFKEGYPLRIENRAVYEKMAVDSFKLSVSSSEKTTQIHTHMCYSEFGDIIKTIEAMDADVISIETARSGNRLLKIFKDVGYKNEIGLGIYDIHSPRVPSVDEMVAQIKALLTVLPKEQLWINPDCGLKTRKWEEVRESLKNLVEAVKIVKTTSL